MNTVCNCSNATLFAFLQKASSADLLTLSAWIDLRNSFYSSAQTKLKSVLVHNPSSYYAHYLLGIYYLKVFHLRSALTSFHNVLKFSENPSPSLLNNILPKRRVIRLSELRLNQLEKKIPGSSYSEIFVVSIQNSNLSDQMDFSTRLSCLDSFILRGGDLGILAREKKIRLLFSKSDFDYEDLNESTSLFLQLAEKKAIDKKFTHFFMQRIEKLIELFSDDETSCDSVFLAKCFQVQKCINRVSMLTLARKDQ